MHYSYARAKITESADKIHHIRPRLKLYFYIKIGHDMWNSSSTICRQQIMHNYCTTGNSARAVSLHRVCQMFYSVVSNGKPQLKPMFT